MTWKSPIESTVYFDSPRIRIGGFRCSPASRLWSTENISGDLPLVVFPRTAVEIHQADRHSVVATPIHAMLYNSSQPYRRDMIDPRGDICEFYCVAPSLLQEVLQDIGVPLPQRLDSPFEFSHAPCSAKIYLAQRALFRAIERSEVRDPILVEEVFFELLTRLLDQSFQFHNPFVRRQRHFAPARWDQVEAAKDFISRNFRSRLDVQEIADYVECSVFHLCRIFKKLTGQTIHHFLLQFRIRSAVERILDGDNSLTEIALDHCFSSHSHFSNSFRKRFGTSPSDLRRRSLVSTCQRLLSDCSDI